MIRRIVFSLTVLVAACSSDDATPVERLCQAVRDDLEEASTMTEEERADADIGVRTSTIMGAEDLDSDDLRLECQEEFSQLMDVLSGR